MSDMIWNGSYTLGNSQETEITAGTGIKVTTPAAGQIQISNDETVLFENANGTMLKNGITLSESRLNFEYIRILYNVYGAPAYIDVPMFGLNRGATFILTLTAPFNNHAYNEASYFIIWQCFLADCTETYLKSSSCQFIGKMNFIDGGTPGTWTQGANADVPTIYKVIGINRIAGGN